MSRQGLIVKFLCPSSKQNVLGFAVNLPKRSLSRRSCKGQETEAICVITGSCIGAPQFKEVLITACLTGSRAPPSSRRDQKARSLESSRTLNQQNTAGFYPQPWCTSGPGALSLSDQTLITSPCKHAGRKKQLRKRQRFHS